MLLKISLMCPLSNAIAPLFPKYETGINNGYNNFTFLGKSSGISTVAPIENEINPSRMLVSVGFGLGFCLVCCFVLFVCGGFYLFVCFPIEEKEKYLLLILLQNMSLLFFNYSFICSLLRLDSMLKEN